MSNQRRAITYGRQNNKSPFSHDFEALSIATPKKSVLNPPIASPIRSSKPAAESADPFDVPLSDSEEDSGYNVPLGSPTPRRRSPAKRLPNPVPVAKKSTAPPPTNPPMQAPASSVKLDQASGKRKRSTSVSSPRQASEVRSRAGAKEPVGNKPPKQNSNALTTKQSGFPNSAPRPRGRPPGSKNKPKELSKSSPAKSATIAKKTQRENLPLPAEIVNTIEETGEDVFDVPDDQDQLLVTPGKSRAAKIQRVGRNSTPVTPRVSSSASETTSSTSKTSKIATTPRQAKLWSNLLGDDNTCTTFSPKDQRQSKSSPPRLRLIDSLKASRPRSEDGSDVSISDMSFSESEMDIDARQSEDETAAVHPSQESKAPGSSSLESIQPASHTAGPRFTYGQQRSYLQDEPQSLDQLLSQPLELGASPGNGKNQLSQGQGREDFSDDDNDDGGAAGMRSIHELRAAGDERRFDDDMNTMLDDIAAKDKIGLSGKRSALIDLSEKLKDAKLKTRFVNRSLEFEVFDRCRGESDPVAIAALSVCLVHILTEPYDIRSAQLVYEADALTTITTALEGVKDLRLVVRDRKMNMARQAQNSVAEFVKGLDTMKFWKGRSPNTASPQMLSMKALEMLVCRLRESSVTDAILTPDIVSRLVQVLPAGLYAIDAERVDEDSASLVSLEIGLSTLESASVSPACALEVKLWSKASLAAIARTVSRLVATPNTVATDLQTLSLRLCLNLANNSVRNSDAFAISDLLGHLMKAINRGFSDLGNILNEPSRRNEFDELVLALGATFNLAEMSERVRLIMVSDHEQVLAEMVSIFSATRGKAQEADSLEASQANVAYGYLAVLLGNICQNPEGRRAVCISMPGASTTPLTEAIEEFIMHHKAVDMQGQSDMWKTFTDRLQAVADRLRM